MSSPPLRPVGFRLPAVLAKTAAVLGRHFGCPSACLIGALPAVVGAAAGPCRLETNLWSQPISPALDLAFCLPEDQRLQMAIDQSLKPLQEIQDRSWSVLQDPEAVGNPVETELAWLNSQPFVLLNNPVAGQLAEAAQQTQSSSMLVVYDEAGWKEILKKARNRAKIDLVLLQRGWAGQSCAAPEAGGIVRDLSVGSVVFCRPTTWGRSLTSKNTLVMNLAGQFLLMEGGHDSKAPSPSTDLPRLLRQWRELINRLVEFCQRTGPHTIYLSPEAFQLLMDLWRRTLSEGARSFQGHVALIAGKLALIFHLVLVGPKARVSAEIMDQAIGMAQWLARGTSAGMDRLVGEAQEAALREEAEEMLERIRQEPPRTWRQLVRTYHAQGTDLHQPARDRLLTSGLGRL